MARAKRFPKNSMDKETKETVPLTQAPTDSGGGPSIMAKDTGNTEHGKKLDYDYSLEKPEENIENEDLSNWLFEYWGNLDTEVERIATLAGKMHAFSSNTRNLHKEMKGWCDELIRLSDIAKRRSDALKAFVDKSSDRIDELSTSLLEVTQISNKTTVPTAEVGCGTETGDALIIRSEEQNTTKRINTRRKKKLTPAQDRQTDIPESKRVKSKMKKQCNPDKKKEAVTKAKGTTEYPRGNRGRKKYEAVVVKPSGTNTYADVVKCLKSNIDVSKLGANIRSMRRTNTGDVLLQMAKGPEQEAAVLKLRDAINEAVGTTATVRYKPATAIIEIRDLEPDTSEDEIIDAFSRSFESVQGVPTVLRTQLSFGGCKRAIVKLQEELATALLKRGSIVIGLVNCRVRIKDRVPRCYRCHNYGHLRTVCTGPDRTALCMTCGSANHHAIECSNQPRCVLCMDDGGDGNHYPGSAKCNAFQLAKRKIS